MKLSELFVYLVVFIQCIYSKNLENNPLVEKLGLIFKSLLIIQPKNTGRHIHRIIKTINCDGLIVNYLFFLKNKICRYTFVRVK